MNTQRELIQLAVEFSYMQNTKDNHACAAYAVMTMRNDYRAEALALAIVNADTDTDWYRKVDEFVALAQGNDPNKFHRSFAILSKKIELTLAERDSLNTGSTNYAFFD